MTREQTIRVMIEKAIRLSKKYDYNLENEIWDIASDWNREHENEEIFMCEHEDEEVGYVNGFYIEDDYFIIKD